MTAPILTERSVLGMFYERLQQDLGMSWIDPISTPVIRSDQDQETYPWIGQVPQMSAKAGTKTFDQLRTTSWQVANVEYQGGIAIPEKFVLYDKTDQVRVRVNELADRAMAHWATLVAPLIIAGESTACYDGQYFFDTNHSEGSSGTQDNDISVSLAGLPVTNAGSLTAPSGPTMIYAILEAVEQILGFKDDRGEYVNENMTEFLVLTGTTFLAGALAALRARSVDGGDSNLLMEQDSFRFRVASSPRFNSWTTKFAVFATQGMQKPVIRQQRVPNEAGSAFNVEGMAVETLWLGSEHCKKHDEVLMSVETERAVAYGDWKKACLVTLAS